MMKKILNLILILIMTSINARADLYDITGISVQAERDTVQEARQAAITEAQTEAFWALMNRMLIQDDVSRISLPDEATLTDFVRNVSVADEKMTATKYMATLSVRFNPEKIQHFLTDNRIPFLTQSLPSTVIIPAFRKEGTVLLLEENNPVYEFLRTRAPDNPLCEITIPVGDLEEMSAARDMWSSGDLSAFQQFADRYHAQRVLLLFVKQQGPYVSAETRSYPPLPDESQLTPIDVMAPTGNITSVLPEIWERLMDKQIAAWRSVKTNNFTTQGTVWIRIPIKSLSNWIHLQNKLKKIPLLETAEVRGFRPNEVLMALSTTQNNDDISKLLSKQGLRLTETTAPNVFILRSSSATEREYQ